MPIDDKKNAKNKNGDAKKTKETKETSSSPLSQKDEKKTPLTENTPPPIKDTPPKTDSLNKKEEKKETVSSKKPPKAPPKIAAKDEKPKKKSNLPVFLWPVVCSVITAGGLIGTKDMWMGTTSLNTPQNMAVDSKYVENQQKEIAMLKEQIALLSERLDAQAERPAQEDKATAETMEPAAAVIENKDEVTPEIAPEESETLDTGTEEAEATSNEETNVENSAEDVAIETSPEATTEASLAEASPETPMLVEPVDDTQSNNDELWQVIDTQKQKIDDLQTEISGLQQRSAEWLQIAQQDTAESIKSVEERITNGENRIQNLEALIAQLESELALLKKQLAEMQETPPQTALATQFMALDNLTNRIQSGEDYTDALKAFEAASEITNQTLAQNVKGITPLHRLIAEFKPVSHDILTTERKARANEQGSQKQKLLSSFNDLVSISRTDGGAEGSVDRLIYDMEQALENGDVASALALLDTTAAQTREISENWRQKALNYQDVMQGLAALRDKVADESAATDKAGE